MRFVTFRIHTESRVGLVKEGRIIDLNSAYALYLRDAEAEVDARRIADTFTPPDMKAFLRTGERGLDAARKVYKFIDVDEEAKGIDGEKIVFDFDEVRLDAPIPNPDKVYCLAVNYYSHFAEVMGVPLEEAKRRVDSWGLTVPVIFQKPSTSIIGPGDPIIIPRVSSKVDYEVELAVVIGKKGKYIPKKEVEEYIAGYMVFNDVSFRDQGFPKSGFKYYNQVNWVKGKGLDNSAPTGPQLVTRDEVSDPYNLKMFTRVNGETRQEGSTGDMIIRIPEIIEYLSNGLTLNPGDLISTGTCAGVALVSGLYLKPGDVVETEIEKLGVLSNPVIKEL